MEIKTVILSISNDCLIPKYFFRCAYLRLRAEEQERFNAEVEKLPTKEREGVMEIMTSWKEEGRQQGLQQGQQQGQQQASASMVLRQLKKRFRKLNKRTEAHIYKLSTETLQDLGEALLDFKDTTDLEVWLGKISNNNQ